MQAFGPKLSLLRNGPISVELCAGPLDKIAMLALFRTLIWFRHGVLLASAGKKSFSTLPCLGCAYFGFELTKM